MKKILLCFLFFGSLIAKGQKTDIVTGIVNSKEDNLPVPGVNVYIKYNNAIISSAITDVNGKYNITVPDTLRNFKIVYSFIGMKTKEIDVIRKPKNDGKKK